MSFLRAYHKSPGILEQDINRYDLVVQVEVPVEQGAPTVEDEISRVYSLKRLSRVK